MLFFYLFTITFLFYFKIPPEVALQSLPAASSELRVSSDGWKGKLQELQSVSKWFLLTFSPFIHGVFAASVACSLKNTLLSALTGATVQSRGANEQLHRNSWAQRQHWGVFPQHPPSLLKTVSVKQVCLRHLRPIYRLLWLRNSFYDAIKWWNIRVNYTVSYILHYITAKVMWVILIKTNVFSSSTFCEIEVKSTTALTLDLLRWATYVVLQPHQ